MSDSEKPNGTDGDRTLRIELTAAEYDDPNIRFDLVELSDFLDAEADAQGARGSSLTLDNLALTVSGWRSVELYVDGTATKITPSAPLFANDDDIVDCDDTATAERLAWADRHGAGDTMTPVTDGTQTANGCFANDAVIQDELDAIIRGDFGNVALYRGARNDLVLGNAEDGTDSMFGDGDNRVSDLGHGSDVADAREDSGHDSNVILDAYLPGRFGGNNGASGAASGRFGNIIFGAGQNGEGNTRVGSHQVNRTDIGAGSDAIVVTAANLGFYIALNADNGNEGPQNNDDTVILTGLYDTSLYRLDDGDDVFFGDNGADQVFDRTGGDDITGDAGDDSLFGGEGGDVPRGTSDHDRLAAGAGNDALTAGKHGDVVIGGATADVITGSGNDTIVFNPGLAVAVDEFGTYFTSGDISISGGGRTDTLIGADNGIVVDLNESRYQGTTGGISRFAFGNLDDAPTGRMHATITEQPTIPDEAGDDIVSLFAVTTSNLDISHIDPAYNPSTKVWTISYAGASGTASVTLSASQIVGDPPYGFTNFFVDSDVWATFVTNTNFASANFIDGGTGRNVRLEGSEGSDVIFGGENSADPSPSVDSDDFIYAGQGNDILVGGSGYDVYHIGRGWDDNIIIDGNDPVGGYANGLIFFTGFEPDGNFVGGSVTGDNYKYQGDGVWTTGNSGGSNGIRFTDNADGTWTVAFNEGGGAATFAAEEITEIDLYSYDPHNVDRFVYDPANNRYDLVAYELDVNDLDLFYIDTTDTWSVTFTGQSGQQTVNLSSGQVVDGATWDPGRNLKSIFDNAEFTGANFIDGGLRHNDLIDVPARTNIVFGGDSALDPAPDGPVDDHLYSTQEGDILVGGAGYDVYQVGRGQGDNIIIDGNGPVNGYANKLVLTPDFNVNGEFDAGTVTGENFTDRGGGVWTTGDGAGQNGVTFTNNADGTWTIAFNEGGGSVTFAADEISAIELRSYGADGAYVDTDNFVYDPVDNEYDVV